MRTLGLLCVSAVVFISVAATVRAQMGMRSGPPGLSGLWQPTVGAAASYDVERPGQPKQPFEFAVIGKEKIQGNDGVWVEFTINAEQIGMMVVKELVSFDPAKMQMQTFKAVIQLPGHPPMELPDEMMQSRPFQFKDVRESTDLGSQSVTTPAGTFACEHYRGKDGSGEFWVSKQVVPIGLVKSQQNGQTVTLVKLVTDAKDKISGTAQPFDPMMFMPQRPQQ
ncbi:MAG TPA: hypothetical protein VMF66_01745 [Candidatus Acidoferrum sp.]|nr:hypothetical protein [Candidatus Acidoferrum sp.]